MLGFSKGLIDEFVLVVGVFVAGQCEWVSLFTFTLMPPPPHGQHRSTADLNGLAQTELDVT